MPRFWLELPGGKIVIRSPEDLLDAMRTHASLESLGALADAARWDSEAGAVFARECVMWCLRQSAWRALEYGRGRMGNLTTGQIIFLVLASAPDGVTMDELCERVSSYAVETTGGLGFVLARLVRDGFVHASEGVFCVPGPRPCMWDAL